MLNYRFLLLCLLMSFGLPLTGQDYLISAIEFTGNERTRTAHLRQFVSAKIGEPLNKPALDEDLRRLRQLEILYDASYQIDTIENQIELSYHVKETIARLPILAFGGVGDNAWWMGGISDVNLRGQGDKVTLALRQIDGQLGGLLAYEKPHIKGSPWGLGLRFERYASIEPLYFSEGQVDYQYRNHSISGHLRYRFDLDRDLSFGFSLFQENFEKNDPEILFGVNQRTENKALLGLRYSQHKVDQGVIYQAGYRFFVSAETVLQENNNPLFYLLRFQSQHFKRTGKRGNVAARISFGLSSNVNSPFAPFVIDSRINIRGAGNRIERGTAAFVFNLEYRHTLIDSKNLVVQGVAFSDTGTWRNPGGRISELWSAETLQLFAGAGIRFIYPNAGNAIFRVDYGKDIRGLGVRGIVLGLGQFF